MENPFKPDEKVLTKVKGADVEATVAQIFNNEVQVKTADGKLLWRTMHTVWYPGGSPIQKGEKPKVEVTTQTAPPAPPDESAPAASGATSEPATAAADTAPEAEVNKPNPPELVEPAPSKQRWEVCGIEPHRKPKRHRRKV